MSALIVEPNQAKAKAISLYEKVEASAKKTLQYAVELGQFLIETKQAMGHGAFGQWLSELPFSDRTARRYMDIARNPEAIQGATNISQAYISLSGKTDTMANLNPGKQDEVLHSLVQLTERAWHLQFSKIPIVELVWSKEKYEFTCWLRDTWEGFDKLNTYLKNHISEQITASKHGLDSDFRKWSWADCMAYCLDSIALELNQTTYEQAFERYIGELKEKNKLDAIHEVYRQQKEIAFGNTSIAEAAWTIVTNNQVEALKEDVGALKLVVDTLQSRLYPPKQL